MLLHVDPCKDEQIQLFILGSVTEVFVDVKPYGSREDSYTRPGDIVSFPLPQPIYGYTIRCHVQATTTNVSITMKLADRIVPGKL